MSEPIWLPRDLVCAIHDEQLSIHGGPSGFRDEGMLLSVLDRPRNKWGYGETDLIVLAAAVGFGLARNHPFIDGNKRAAFLSIITFLGLNGWNFVADETEAVVVIEQMAGGSISKEELAAWLRDNAKLA
jgi:death on curing protein